jgi:hypothetical protein
MYRERRVDALGPRVGHKPEVLHPFVGFVRRPAKFADGLSEFGVTDFGYIDDKLPLRTRGSDRIIVAIVGGSVAEQFATSVADRFERELQNRSKFFAGKKVEFIRIALSGYKQPQQLMTIAYLLTLGGQFDVVVNIDGYNEVVLPKLENAPAGVFPSYPRVWQARVVETTDSTVLRMLGRISYLHARSQYWSDVFGSRPARFSPMLNLIWLGLDKFIQDSLNREFVAYNNQRSQDRDYGFTGPMREFADDAEYYEHCASVWRIASWQLHQLCAANGIRYFHFLQPNQYVPGSKPIFDPEEKMRAYKLGHSGREPVERGYPLLVREGAELAAQGVHFHDLTGLFRDHPEWIYADFCCHYNQHGNELLADRIAELIGSDLDQTP